MSEYNSALRNRLSDFRTVTRHPEDKTIRVADEGERLFRVVSGGYGGIMARGTSPDGQQVIILGTEPTSVSKGLLAHAVAPIAGAVASVMMGMTPWRRGTEADAMWRISPLYEQTTLYTWRLSVSEARRRAREVQLNADRRRLQFFARDAERELDRAASYDL